MNTREDIEQYLIMDTDIVNNTDGHVISAHSTYPDDSNELFIVFNNDSNKKIQLPAGNWTQIADASGATNIMGLSDSAAIEGTAVTIFRKD